MSKKNDNDSLQFDVKNLYENIIEGVQDGIWVTDKDDVIFFCNRTMELIAGVPRNLIIGNNVLKDFPKETIGQFGKSYLQAKKTLKTVWYEVAVKTPAGRNTWQNGWLIPQIQVGKFNGIICTIRDVTERKEAQEEIETIWNVSPDLLCVADINTATFLKISPSFTKTLGYTEAELLGKPFLEFVHPDDVQPTIDVIENKLKKDIYVINFTNRYRCKNGSYRYLNWVSRPIVERGETYAIARDFTDQIIAEKKVEAAREIAELYLQMAGSIFVSLNQNGEVLLTNKKAEDVLGYTREELVGKNWFDTCIPKEVVPQVKDVFNKVITGEMDGVEHFDNDVVTKSGQLKTISWYNSYMRDDDGVIKHLLSSGIDVTSQKKYLEEIKNKNEFIQTVMDSLPIGLALNEIDKGEATYINRKFEEIYGWPAEELKNISEFFKKVYPDQDYREKLQKKVLADIMSGDPNRMHWENLEIIHKDGTHKYINAVNIPLLRQNVMVSTVMDVTAQKEAERELKKHRDHLEKLVKERTRELEEKNAELEHYNKLFIGREFRIKELKDKIKELKIKLGEEANDEDGS